MIEIYSIYKKKRKTNVKFTLVWLFRITSHSPLPILTQLKYFLHNFPLDKNKIVWFNDSFEFIDDEQDEEEKFIISSFR